MKLNAERPQGNNAISAYGSGFVTVNGLTYSHSVIVGHDSQPRPWPVSAIDELTTEHLTGLHQSADVVLLGTGVRQRFPSREILRPFLSKRLPIDVMDTAAACRTYNVLLAEGRAVVVALIIE